MLNPPALDELAAAGVAVLLVSSELPELVNLTTRILVMCERRGGCPVNSFDRGTMDLVAPMLVALACGLFVPAALAAPVELFGLDRVRLLDGPFARGQELNREYLLAHDPDRLLAPFLREAGLEPKAEPYGNWESQGLDGHSAGHYLSALAMTYAVTGDAECKQRLDYMVAELARVQEVNGYGYVGGVPDSQRVWSRVTDGDALDVHGFGLEGAWVPWYNLHKTFAGLRDAYRVAGNEQARDVLVKLADWCGSVLDQLSDEQMANMLRAEHGGMNEVLADVSAITGDARYLRMAERFSDRAILNPLLAGRDDLTGKHANTQIPKVIGYDRIAELGGGDKRWHDAAALFWKNVVEGRSVAIGGNSVGEHFHPADDFSRMIEDRSGPETCNTYNMLRLTESLFRGDAGDVQRGRYADYYERALFNHIRSSQNPETGGYVYFTPMRPRHYRVYSQPEQAFWCCVGSGFESHSKYGEFIYAHEGDGALYVNLFIASRLDWRERGLTLHQETNFPEAPRTTLRLSLAEPTTFALRIRHPSWAGEGYAVTVNGEAAEVGSELGGYTTIEREWRDGDVVKVELPMSLAIEPLPDGSDYVAFRYGPIILAAATGTDDLDGLFAGSGRMEHVAEGPLRPIATAPTLVAEQGEVADHVIRLEGDSLTFEIAPLIVRPEQSQPLRLVPFARLHEARYQIYWPINSPEAYDEQQRQLAAAEAERLRLEALTIDRVVPGEQQTEVEHNFRGERTDSGSFMGRSWRHAAGWFSYDLAVPKEPADLVFTVSGRDRGRTFDVLINGEVLDTVENAGDERDFVDHRYPLPEALQGKTITVRFEAHNDSLAGGLFDLRIVRREPAE